MSSLKEQKAKILAKLAKQKANKQKKIFKIPKLHLSSTEKKKQVQKTFIPTEKTLIKRSKDEDQIRIFLTEVNNLTEDDFINPTVQENILNDYLTYDNKIVNDGYQLYKKTFIRDSAISVDPEDFDRESIVKQINKDWMESSLRTKLIWVLKGFAALKTSPWGMKNFVDSIASNIRSHAMLQKFINDYLASNSRYDKFIERWEVSQFGGKEELKDLLEAEEDAEKEEKSENDKKYPIVNVLGTNIEKIPRHDRLALTEEENEQLDNMKERLSGYEEAFTNLQEKISTREEKLSEMSYEDLVEMAVPILGRKTNDQLIDYLIDIEYEPMINENYKILFGNDWKEYEQKIQLYKKIVKEDGQKKADEIFGSVPMHHLSAEKMAEHDAFKKEIDVEKVSKRSELRSLSRHDLVLAATEQKTIPNLVRLLIRTEFGDNMKKIKDKISLLSIQIHNLGLGKFVHHKKGEKRLLYKERVYKSALEVYIRKVELETWSYNKLLLHAGNIGAIKDVDVDPLEELMKKYGSGASGKNTKESEYKSFQENTVEKLIVNILKSEFPGSNPDKPIPKVDRNEMYNVLLTLTEEQLYILAVASGISKPERRGKHQIIEMILKLEFSRTERKTTQQLVRGRYVRNWSYMKRKEELNDMSPNEIRELAFTMGLNLNTGIKTENLIEGILANEEMIARLIPKEDIEKEKLIKKISEITGQSKSRYVLWSLDELKERLNTLGYENQEYWVELEKERLVKKLSQLVDINSEKYSKAHKWKLKKLRRTLKKLAGHDWENYQPLVEDYSFVKCMEEHNRFNWIDGKVTGVWLASSTGQRPKSDYIHKDVWIEEDGHKWYQANKKFFVLQCNLYKSRRKQNGDILTCYTQAGKVVKFKVGYTIIGYKYDLNRYKARSHIIDRGDGQMVRRTFIIQDEFMFNKEKQASRRTNQTEFSRIQDILSSLVSENSISLVTKTISQTLTELAPMKKDYGIVKVTNDKGITSKSLDPNTPYMQILVNTLLTGPDQTNRELFTKAANLLVYLDIPEAKIFRKNIEIEYYLPDVLASLSPEEKFPEVYDDANIDERIINQLTSDVNNKISKLVNEMSRQIYRAEDPTRRVRTIPQTSFGQKIIKIKTQKRLSACANKDRVQNASPEEIIYYKEDDKIYCFTIDELYEQFINGDITNPETGNQFNIKFVERFDQLYNKQLASDGFLTNYFQQKYGFDMKELVDEKEKDDTIERFRPKIAPNLWEIVGDDIAELEDQLSNEKPEDGDEIDEEREEERRDAEVDKGTRETRDIDQEDACVYCTTHISDDSIKTLVKHGDESRIIKFCSFKCFEDKNDWEKFKKDRKKKEKKSKKKEKKKIDDAVEKVTTKRKPKVKTPIKLSKVELRERKKIITKKIKDGVMEFDRIALPLMNKSELMKLAREKEIKIPGGLSKKAIAKYIFEKLHPKVRQSPSKSQK